MLVHEVHAATGPGFNVYACQECAGHYPPFPDAYELLEATPRRRSRLTLRVYRVDAAGAVTEDRGRVEVLTGGRGAALPLTSAYPPCRCPRCRTR
ncbi:hypothetical protein ACLVWQ_20275 [Streptomyces sp. CWNU-52B]|uniref:hypothetical protein n=1 Tax=unclassified Streptomyces TaxID=2593676 RepID=UPI0039C3F627